MARDFMSPEVDAAFTLLLPWLDALLSTWELYLRVGGFPRAVSDQLARGDVREDFLRALWDVTAGEALRGAGTSPAQVQAMLVRLTRSLGSPLAIESLRGDIGVEIHHTAKARLQDLVFAYLAWPVTGARATRRTLGQSKYYFIDPLLARQASLRSQGALAEADASVLSEQQLGIELLRNIEREQPGASGPFATPMNEIPRKEVVFSNSSRPRTGLRGKVHRCRLEARGAHRPSGSRSGSARHARPARHQRRRMASPRDLHGRCSTLRPRRALRRIRCVAQGGVRFART